MNLVDVIIQVTEPLVYLNPNAPTPASQPCQVHQPHSRKQLRRIQLIPRLLEAIRPQAQLIMSREPLNALLGPLVIPARLLLAHLRADLVRAHKLLILVDHRSAERALEDHNRREHEARADLDEAELRLHAPDLLRLLGRRLVGVVASTELRRDRLVDLVVPDPDLAVGEREAHDVVDEGLGLARALGHAEDVQEHLLEEAEVRLLVELGVEGEDGAGALEAVACEVELFHCVHCVMAS